MGTSNIYETVKQAVQDIVPPGLARIEGRLDAINSEIHRLNEKIESLDKRFSERFDFMEKRIDTAIDIHERLATLEAKVASIH